MKKIFLPLLAFAFITATTSSCTKCYTCKKGDQWSKYCDKDYDKDDIDNAITLAEAAGYDCKASSQMY